MSGRASPDGPGTTVPLAYRVRSATADSVDIVTIVLDPVDAAIPAPSPGQFTMVSVFGSGEVPISISAVPVADQGLTLTIRDAGPTTRQLTAVRGGDVVGVRGPFGVGWPELDGDVVVVAGGIGLVPLLPAIRRLAVRPGPSQLSILVGARRPVDLLAVDELHDLATTHQVLRTVDAADAGWRGEVGVVTELLPRVAGDPRTRHALVCGPEIMMKHTARALLAEGTDPAQIWVSLERNMHCGHGSCGHCQLGPLFLCTDGPVVSWARAEPVLAVRSR